MKKIILLVFLILLISPMVVGQSLTFKQNEEINFRFRCLNDSNQYCSSGTSLLLSIEAPNGSNVVDNSSMTANPTFFNHTLPTTGLGIYSAIILSPTAVNTSSEFTYLVTPNGFTLGVGQALLYGVFIFLGIVLFGLSLWGAIVIPYNNPRDSDGFIFQMNHLKYIKIFLWWFTYIVALFIAFLSRGVSGGFLFNNTAALFFKWVYQFMLAFLFPVIILTVLIAFVNFIGDRGIMRDIERGLKVK